MEKLYNEELHNVYVPPDTVKEIELSRMWWVKPFSFIQEPAF
jgi:hypothetical protein